MFWNSVFKWVYLSFSPLPLASLLFSVTYKSSSDDHFAFLHFFFLGIVLITASCTVSRTSIHNSSGTPSIFIAKFRLKLKKIGKTTRLLRYDLNKIPYVTVVVTNRFTVLDLINTVPENYGWRFLTLYRSQWSRPSPRKRSAQRQKSCLMSSYKYLRKEEKLKAKEKREDMPIRVQSSKE